MLLQLTVINQTGLVNHHVGIYGVSVVGSRRRREKGSPGAIIGNGHGWRDDGENRAPRTSSSYYESLRLLPLYIGGLDLYVKCWMAAFSHRT